MGPGWVRFPFASANMRRRGAVLRGTVAAMVAVLGIALLIYGGMFGDRVVSTETEVSEVVQPPPLPPSLVAERQRMGLPPLRQEPPRIVKKKEIDYLSLSEANMVRGVTIGALARLESGELRMTTILEGAAQCPT